MGIEHLNFFFFNKIIFQPQRTTLTLYDNIIIIIITIYGTRKL